MSRAVGDSQSYCVNEFWMKNTSVMTYSQWESNIQGSGKLGEDCFNHLQTMCIDFPIRIDKYTGRLHEDEEARVFPVNNIL